MIRKIFLGALMLSLAAGSLAKAADDPFIDKLSSLVAPYVFCVQAEALAIDDGVSDALTIGGAAMDICRPILMTTKSWFLALPKLTADQREKARIYLDGTEP